MLVYLLRHGIAEPHQAGKRDADRVLTEEGREKLEAVLERARKAGVKPTLIVTSPYVRAVQTAEMAARILDCGQMLESNALIPESSPEEVWAEICLHRREEALLLAGHEPLFGATAAYLLGAPNVRIDFKKGALLAVRNDSFLPVPGAELLWFLVPKLAS
jgi:phosphohistidine phosphatase